MLRENLGWAWKESVTKVIFEPNLLHKNWLEWFDGLTHKGFSRIFEAIYWGGIIFWAVLRKRMDLIKVIKLQYSHLISFGRGGGGV